MKTLEELMALVHRVTFKPPSTQFKADLDVIESALRELIADAERYRWLCNVGQHREIVGTGTQVPGRGPFVAMSFPAVYAPAGSVGFESKEEIDAAIDDARAIRQ